MAKMIPPEWEKKIEDNPGEQLMYRLLSGMPDDWIIRYNYQISYLRYGKNFDVCEADFIIMVPHRGIMFMEVKSAERYKCENGEWFRWNQQDYAYAATKDPFIQVCNTKMKIVQKLRADWNWDSFPGIFGHLVAYPRAKADGGRRYSPQEPGILLLEKDMGDLKNRILDAFELWGKSVSIPDLGRQFTVAVAAQLAKYFESNWACFVTGQSEIDDFEQKVRELTRNQLAVYSEILSLDSAVVRGCAGSGKTMLATWIAERIANTGKSVLFLCFNRVLAESLRRTYRRDNLQIYTFWQLVSELCRRNNVALRSAPALDDAWNALDKGECPQFDTVIVDEMQDFQNEWADIIAYLMKPGCKQYWFGDYMQNLFVRGSSVKQAFDKEYFLTANCRNTKRIAGYSRNVARDTVSEFCANSPEGKPPVISDAIPNETGRKNELKRLVTSLLTQGVLPSEIAILSPFQENTVQIDLPGSIKIAYYSSDSSREAELLTKWQDNKCIWGSTIAAFKGMEAAVVIITDVLENCTDEAMYVGCTRAKFRLHIIPASQKACNKCREWLPLSD